MVMTMMANTMPALPPPPPPQPQPPHHHYHHYTTIAFYCCCCCCCAVAAAATASLYYTVLLQLYEAIEKPKHLHRSAPAEAGSEGDAHERVGESGGARVLGDAKLGK